LAPCLGRDQGQANSRPLKFATTTPEVGGIHGKRVEKIGSEDA
jgi:hypothetical protein